MVSIAQGLRMMGGGKDTSGYADMLDAMEVRDLLGERRAAAAATQQQQEQYHINNRRSRRLQTSR